MTAADGRKFAFTVGGAFLVFGGIAWWRGHPATATGLLSLGGVLGALGALVPARLGPVQRAWMGFALLLSRVTTPILMSIIFFLVITPVALIMRMLGRAPLRTDRSAPSYWVVREEGHTRSDLTRQF